MGGDTHLQGMLEVLWHLHFMGQACALNINFVKKPAMVYCSITGFTFTYMSFHMCVHLNAEKRKYTKIPKYGRNHLNVKMYINKGYQIVKIKSGDILLTTPTRIHAHICSQTHKITPSFLTCPLTIGQRHLTRGRQSMYKAKILWAR